MKKIIIFSCLFIIFSCDYNTVSIEYKRLEGYAFGTTFHINYENRSDINFERQIDSLIHLMNRSLSTYMPNSDISRINQGDSSIVVDELFREVFEKSTKIYKETDGWYDPTIGIIVNAWGFGPEEAGKTDSLEITRLLEFVGFDKVEIDRGKVTKKHREIYFDFNALAKGYGVDVIGRFLETNQIENYMVEIGGEIRARGVNQKKHPWLIAVEAPNFEGSRTFQSKIQLRNESIATSGNYRKFRIDSVSGEKYAHIINPKTGFPTKSNLLSASVISKDDCANVDGYATAFMAMGLKATQEFVKEHRDLKVFLIYSDDQGNLKTFASDNFPDHDHEHD